MAERDPDFDEQDSGVPVTPAHNPDPLQPQHAPPQADLEGGGEGGSPAEHVRERSGGGDDDANRPSDRSEGGHAAPGTESGAGAGQSGIEESDPATGL